MVTIVATGWRWQQLIVNDIPVPSLPFLPSLFNPRCREAALRPLPPLPFFRPFPPSPSPFPFPFPASSPVDDRILPCRLHPSRR